MNLLLDTHALLWFLDSQGGSRPHVRIGVTALKDMTVDRQEVHDRRSQFVDGFSQSEQFSLLRRSGSQQSWVQS